MKDKIVEELEDGIIELDSSRAKIFGFTSTLYDGYLWKSGKTIYISFIESKRRRQGNLNRLFESIEKAGFRVAVPTPLGLMESILIKKGWSATIEEEAEVWRKPNDLYIARGVYEENRRIRGL